MYMCTVHRYCPNSSPTVLGEYVSCGPPTKSLSTVWPCYSVNNIFCYLVLLCEQSLLLSLTNSIGTLQHIPLNYVDFSLCFPTDWHLVANPNNRCRHCLDRKVRQSWTQTPLELPWEPLLVGSLLGGTVDVNHRSALRRRVLVAMMICRKKRHLKLNHVIQYTILFPFHSVVIKFNLNHLVQRIDIIPSLFVILSILLKSHKTA